MKRKVRTGKKRTAIKFSGRKKSIQGIIATGIGIFTVVLGILLACISTNSKGAAGVWIGLLGLLAVVLAVVGLILAVLSFKEKDIFLTFPMIGLILNGVLLIGFVVLYFIGLSI